MFNIIRKCNQKFTYRLCMLLVFVCFFSTHVTAQNVTISPKSGHLISGKTKNPNERGFVAGYGSYWVHNQLPLTLGFVVLPEIRCPDFGLIVTFCAVAFALNKATIHESIACL